MQGRKLLEQALRAHGIDDPSRTESHISACDQTHPVTDHLLEAGMQFEVWVRDGGNPGMYAAPLGEPPERLGIILKGRHKEVYRVRETLKVTRCIAALFPFGKVVDVGGQGGGVQYILPPNWLLSVEKVP